MDTTEHSTGITAPSTDEVEHCEARTASVTHTMLTQYLRTYWKTYLIPCNQSYKGSLFIALDSNALSDATRASCNLKAEMKKF